jgi:hypothetical protein
LIYHAKGQGNNAAMRAARAGSMDHADVAAIRDGFARGLIPYMGGGSSGEDIARSLVNATVLAQVASVDILSPNAQAFDDYSSPLQAERLRAEGKTVTEPVIQNMNIAGLGGAREQGNE